jgi:hypothetical protein
MKLERQSILGNTVTGYKIVETPAHPNAAEQSNFPEVVSNTPEQDITAILIRRLETESAKIGSRNGSR